MEDARDGFPSSVCIFNFAFCILSRPLRLIFGCVQLQTDIGDTQSQTAIDARSRIEFAIELKIGYCRRLWKGDTGMAKKHMSPKHMTKQSTLQFLTESLPGFTVGQQTSFKLQATGGTEPYTFRISSGTLPQGLSFDSSGEITGTPQDAGDTTVFLEVADAASGKATQAYDVQVAAPA